jgi:lipooligosaccharide transport system permease protein
MNAPLELDDIVIAEWAWAGAKAVLSGFAILVVVWALDISRAPTLPLAIFVVALSGLCFSAIGLCVNALARGYDFFTFYFTLVVTPLTFVSGVYFPMEQLPHWLAAIARVLPLAPAVELARPLVLGHLPAEPLVPLATLVVYTAAALYAALVLTRRRYAR